MKIIIALSALTAAFLLWGCATKKAPLPTASQVELDRFMGAWYPHGYTPILVDKEAHNAVEHYYLDDSGKIFTTYQFRKGSPDGEIKTYKPTGFVVEGTGNARWKMQFFWPVKADYIILYLSDDYNETIIAHPNRKYAWIMSRSTSIDDTTYDALLAKLTDVGYDPSIIKRLPHDWTTDQERQDAIEKAGSSAPLAPR